MASRPSTAPSGIPNVVSDGVWSVAFLMTFLTSAVANGILLRMNLLRGRAFPFLGLGMVFSIIRCITMSLRLAWIYHNESRGLAVAAAIFVAAGAVILYIINILFAERLLRSAHPGLGWSKPIKFFFRFWLVLIPPFLIMLITVSAQALFTEDLETAKIDKKVQQIGVSYLLFLAFLPMPIILLTALLPGRGGRDDFGQGGWLSKVILLLVTSTLLTVNATFKTASAFLPTTLSTGSLWLRDRWAFYVFNFALEAVVVYLNLIFRVDQRFYVPQGCNKPGDYSRNRGTDLQRQSAVVQKRQSKLSGKGKVHSGWLTSSSNIGLVGAPQSQIWLGSYERPNPPEHTDQRYCTCSRPSSCSDSDLEVELDGPERNPWTR